jgi:methyl-accepting chemotaxis protein
MSIQALSSTANRALGGIDRAISEVEQVATNVAASLSDHPGESASQTVAAVTKLPELKQQALANAQVLNTAQELLGELTNKPPR